MKFRKVTASKYAGDRNFNIKQMRDGCFSICIGTTITKWGTGFSTVRAAENFLNNHNYINATTDYLPMSADDIEFITEMYGFEPEANGSFSRDDVSIHVGKNRAGDFVLKLKDKFKKLRTADMDETLDFLDTCFASENVFATAVLRGANFRQIFAAKGPRRSARDITNNLVRVKSSNIWGYGVEIKDNNSKVGDVYIQFKGKNGGPDDIYQYFDVGLNIWRKFLAAPSKGSFFWRYIRNNYMYRKLTGNKRGVLPNAVN